MSTDGAIREVAARQRGLVISEQLYALGLTKDAIDHRVRSGALLRVAPRVLAIGGVPITEEVLRYGAWLECGGRSALSHETAAAHWRLPGFRMRPVQLVRLRDGIFPPVSLARVHTTRVLPDTHVVAADDLLVTTPARTLFDLAPRVHPGRLERLLDKAWAGRLVSWRIMHRTLEELRGKGRSGISVMRALLAARSADYVPPESNLEGRFRQLLRDGRLSEMDRQVTVGSDDERIGRVDFVDRDGRIVVEIQSDLHHTSISDQIADAARRDSLTDAGWEVIEIPEFDLWHRPAHVQQSIRHARSGR